MANLDYGELAATTIEKRSRTIADNVSDNTALLARMKSRGKIRTFDGGTKILEPLDYAENSTYIRFSGYDKLNVGPSQVITAAEYLAKEVGVAVTMSMAERLQNSGGPQQLDLFKARMKNAERTMTNNLSADLYSDGTANAGKQIGGLQIAVPTANESGTYGGINRAVHEYWRTQKVMLGGEPSTSTIKPAMAQLYQRLCRNMDKPDLIPSDDTYYTQFWMSLQEQQRFMDTKMGDMGFPSLKFLGADVVLDGGLGGDHPGGMYFLNCNYIHWRPHKDGNMISLPDRVSVDQAASVAILYFNGNLTVSNASLQGLLTHPGAGN